MVDIQSAAAEIRRGKKKKKKIETTGQRYNGLPFHRAAIISFHSHSLYVIVRRLIKKVYEHTVTLLIVAFLYNL